MTKVMLVEDDNNLREIYEARMQAEGYEIVTAKDGEEALVVAKKEHPDLIISDVMMPKISGFEMLDILRNTEGLKEVKVIMLTALGQSDDQLRADKLGADRYLVKSQVTLEDIVKTAHDLLDAEQPAEITTLPTNALTEPSTAPVTATTVSVTPVVAEPALEVTPAPVAPPVAAVSVSTAEPPDAATSTLQSTLAPTAAPSSGQDTSNVASDTPQSTAQEEAAVEAKIEDFIAGATTEATVPTGVAISQETAQPEVTAEPTAPAVTPTVPVFADAAAVNDDKVMAEAVDNLVASTKASPTTDVQAATPAEPAIPPIPATTIPVTQPVAQPAVGVEPAAPVSDPAPESSVVEIANKKVITPIETPSKPDINQLLAAEEAKQIVSQPTPVQPVEAAAPASIVTPATASPTAAPAPTVVQPPPQNPTDTPFDPNSIAL